MTMVLELDAGLIGGDPEQPWPAVALMMPPEACDRAVQELEAIAALRWRQRDEMMVDLIALDARGASRGVLAQCYSDGALSDMLRHAAETALVPIVVMVARPEAEEDEVIASHAVPLRIDSARQRAIAR